MYTNRDLKNLILPLLVEQVLVILVGFQLAGSCLVPWTEEMVTAVETQNPELAEWLRESLPVQETTPSEK